MQLLVPDVDIAPSSAEQTRRIWVTMSPKSSVIYDDNIDNNNGNDNNDSNNYNSNDNNNYDNDITTTNCNDNDDDTANNCNDNDNDNNNNTKRNIIMHILWDIMHLNMFDLDMD